MDAAESFDLTHLDFSRPIAGVEQIREILPHRFEMEMLTGIVLIDPGRKLIVGYKDVGAQEFWARGHMPGYPLLPGVLMCEAAAQLASYFVMHLDLLQGDFLGFGGLENVRFRAPVRPGCRLVLIATEIRYNRRQTLFNVQGFVGEVMVFEGDIIGVPLQRKKEE